MEMNILDKINLIIKYATSSFMGIELLVLSILLFLFTVLNIKKNNKKVKIMSTVLCLSFLIGIVVAYRSYAVDSFDGFIKSVLSYLYFPSMVVYFFIMVFVNIDIIITIFSKRMPTVKKIVNSFILSLLYFFFMAVVSLAVSNKLDLSSTVSLYTNDTILSFIQVSNIIFFFWCEYTLLYYFYKYLEKKID